VLFCGAARVRRLEPNLADNRQKRQSSDVAERLHGTYRSKILFFLYEQRFWNYLISVTKANLISLDFINLLVYSLLRAGRGLILSLFGAVDGRETTINGSIREEGRRKRWCARGSLEKARCSSRIGSLHGTLYSVPWSVQADIVFYTLI